MPSTLGYLNINANGKKYVNEALDNNRLSRGKYTSLLEKDFAGAHGCTHAVFCNSGTSALQIALATLKEKFDYKDGDEVLVPAITFIATSNVVIQNGLKPVFVDVDRWTYNIDINNLVKKITPRTRCIIPVHLLGLPANMPAIMELANRIGLQVIEDSCETMFAGINGKPVGSFGDMACFSTYVAHILVGGVGGLITTNDSDYATCCRSLLAHGRDNIYLNIDDDNNVPDEQLKRIINRRYSFDRVGYSYRATELEAAIALSEFEVWGPNIEARRHNAEYLKFQLSDIPYVYIQSVPKGYDHSYMMLGATLDHRYNRDDFLLYLEKNGIETRYLFPLLSQPIYRKLFPRAIETCPAAADLERRGFIIGIHQGHTHDDLDHIVKTIKNALDETKS